MLTSPTKSQLKSCTFPLLDWLTHLSKLEVSDREKWLYTGVSSYMILLFFSLTAFTAGVEENEGRAREKENVRLLKQK